jgi:hypothetical protein
LLLSFDKLGSRLLLLIYVLGNRLILVTIDLSLRATVQFIAIDDIKDKMALRVTLASGSMFSSWRAFLLPLALISIIISGTAIFGSHSYNTHESLSSGHLRRALAGIVHPSTARAIGEDEVLRRNYETVVDITAGATEWLAVRYPSVQLREISDSLNVYFRDITAKNGQGESSPQRRSLADLFGSLGGSSTSANSSGGLLSSLGDSITSGLSSLGDGLCKQLASSFPRLCAASRADSFQKLPET